MQGICARPLGNAAPGRTIAVRLGTIKGSHHADRRGRRAGAWSQAAQGRAGVTEPLAVLLVTTVTTAAFHTLIPDHWLPFVLVARTRGWDARRTAVLTAGSALLHVTFSVALGLGAALMGRGAEAAVGLGESIEKLSAGLLALFGLAYALYFLVRGGHQHSFGMHPHHVADAGHSPLTPHPHDLHAEAAHAPKAAPSRGPALPGFHDPAPATGGGLGAWTLAGIVGFNPCVLVIPYIYLASSMGAAALVLVAAAFAVSTVACMVGVAIIGLKGTARLESPFLMRYGEVVSGALIAVTGLVVMLAGG